MSLCLFLLVVFSLRLPQTLHFAVFDTKLASQPQHQNTPLFGAVLRILFSLVSLKLPNNFSNSFTFAFPQIIHCICVSCCGEWPEVPTQLQAQFHLNSRISILQSLMQFPVFIFCD